MMNGPLTETTDRNRTPSPIRRTSPTHITPYKLTEKTCVVNPPAFAAFQPITETRHTVSETRHTVSEKPLPGDTDNPAHAYCNGLELLADAAHSDSNPLNALVEAAKPFKIRTFETQREASKFCLRNSFDGSCNIGIRKRKTDGDIILYDVYSTLPSKRFCAAEFPRDFFLIKAYAPSVVSQHGIYKNPFVLVNMETPGIEHIVHKKGIVRETFKLPDKKNLRLSHHTCTYLQHEKCEHCLHPEWNARCLAGEDFYVIYNETPTMNKRKAEEMTSPRNVP